MRIGLGTWAGICTWSSTKKEALEKHTSLDFIDSDVQLVASQKAKAQG